MTLQPLDGNEASKPVEHPEHGVAADGQERSSHALDVLRVHSSVADQHLSLTNNLYKSYYKG